MRTRLIKLMSHIIILAIVSILIVILFFNKQLNWMSYVCIGIFVIIMLLSLKDRYDDYRYKLNKSNAYKIKYVDSLIFIIRHNGDCYRSYAVENKNIDHKGCMYCYYYHMDDSNTCYSNNKRIYNKTLKLFKNKEELMEILL